MSQKLRRKITFYVPEALAERCQDLAAREGISLSAYLVKALAVEDRIDGLQAWLAERFDRLGGQFGKAQPDEAKTAVARMLLELVALDHLPIQTLLAILRDLKEEIDGMTEKQREHYAVKGRELLAKMNGGSK